MSEPRGAEGLQVMVAEAEDSSRELLVRTLEEWGFSVVQAVDGLDAWQMFESEPVKLIIADWKMPNLDGIELCRKVRSFGHAGYVYFILVSGSDTKEDLLRGLHEGADDYLIKPLEREELRARLRVGERLLTLERELNERTAKLIELNAELESLACIDPLMDIGNRRHFHDMMAKIHHRACRYEQGYGVVICDVDHFKRFNDTYGHLAGDEVLKKVARTMERTLRSSDEIFRYGGEEIVVVLPGQLMDSTLLVAERIRRSVESLGIEHGASSSGVFTLSCGVSVFDPETCKTGWEGVIDSADKALYRAKEQGRNRVCS